MAAKCWRLLKNARHCFRLLRQGRQLLETGHLQIVIDDPAEYFAFDGMCVDEISVKFAREFDKFAAAPSVLPKEPNKQEVEDYLYFVRRRLLP